MDLSKHWWKSKTHWYTAFTFIRDSGVLAIAVTAPWDLWLTPPQAAAMVVLMRVVDSFITAAIRNKTNTGIK